MFLDCIALFNTIVTQYISLYKSFFFWQIMKPAIVITTETQLLSTVAEVRSFETEIGGLGPGKVYEARQYLCISERACCGLSFCPNHEK